MSKQLFSFEATDHESTKLHRLLRRAAKKIAGAQQKLDTYTATLFKRYGHIDPESYQITIITNMVVVSEYPSFEEIAGAQLLATKGGQDA